MQLQVLRTVKNPSHGSGWDRRDLQLQNVVLEEMFVDYVQQRIYSF